MNEEQTLLENRRAMYDLLARLYLKEIDRPFFEALRAMDFPSGTGNPELDEGFARLRAFLEDPGEGDPIENLAVDYARVFLGAGIVEGRVAYPFESVYTSPKHLVMQDAWEDVCRIYAQNGLGCSADSDVHEDHIGLELNFMARLCAKSLEAGASWDRTGLELQLGFLEKHLLNWTDRFAADVAACPAMDFYRAAAVLTTGFLKLDRMILKELLGN